MGYAKLKSDAQLEREMFANIEVRGRGARFRSARLSGNPMDYFAAKAEEVVSTAKALAEADFKKYKPEEPFGGRMEFEYLNSFDVGIIGGIRPGIRLSNNAPHAQIIESGRDELEAAPGHAFALPVKNVRALHRKPVTYAGRTYLMTTKVAEFSGYQIIQRALRAVFA